ncbi:MAG: hypothetical protein INR69_06075 [Mucilaginibacter polytrichastri]|nr:hypothetical protein [Mucilaginibacter polytrichastri]
MKKITFLAAFALLAFTFSAQAQIQKGNVMVGGNISDISFGLDNPNPFSLSLNPKAAWFISDGVALGVDAKLGILAPGKGAGTAINYGVGALGRYYGSTGANTVLNNSRFFGEATIGINGINPAGNEGSTNGLGFSFGPGYTYFITESVGIEALLKYTGTVGFGESAYAHSLGLGIGFQIYLPGKNTANKVQRDAR